MRRLFCAPTWQIEMTLQAGPREAAESPPQRSSASSAMCKPVVRTQSGSLWHMHAPMLANPSHAFTTTQTNPDNRTGSALLCPTARGGVRVASQRPQRPTLCRTPRSKRRAHSQTGPARGNSTSAIRSASVLQLRLVLASRATLRESPTSLPPTSRHPVRRPAPHGRLLRHSRWPAARRPQRPGACPPGFQLHSPLRRRQHRYCIFVRPHALAPLLPHISRKTVSQVSTPSSGYPPCH